MGHSITALIGSRKSLGRLMEQFGPPASTELPFELWIMPLGNLRLDLLKEAPDTVYEGFAYLSPQLANGIVEGLVGGSALYVETEYFGGVGEQAAAFFEGGRLQWMEAASTTNQPAMDTRKGPISRGLAALGVPPTKQPDEFESVGLGRFRSNKDLGLHEWVDED